MRNSYILTLFICFSIFSSLTAQIFENEIYSSNIKTVQLHKKGWPHADPLLLLPNSPQEQWEETLLLSFDDISSDVKSYHYSIIHCSANWEPSDLMETEYIFGFNQNPILDYDYSINTTIDYIHYEIEFPNNDINLFYSGNYIIKVFEDEDVDHPILVQRFRVREELVEIKSSVKFTYNSNQRSEAQELWINLFHPNLKISNPREELKLFIYQNGRTDNAYTNILPVYIRKDELVYGANREFIFEGGNEFRWLDIRSTRFFSKNVRDIVFHDPFSHIELFPDEIRSQKSYFFQSDYNGKYIINIQEYDDDKIQAEYVFVHFYLPMDKPLPEGNLYILGALSNWKFNTDNQLKYNYNTSTYEGTLLLKQGFYNYQYAFLNKYEKQAHVVYTEGSFSQTGNDYTILAYYRSFGDNYDRLIGAAQVNSLTSKSTNSGLLQMNKKY